MSRESEMVERRFARVYNGGSMNVASANESEADAVRLISGSSDDDDTQLVEVEVRIIRRLMHRGLSVVSKSRTEELELELELARDALAAAYARSGSPEDLAAKNLADAALTPSQAGDA